MGYICTRCGGTNVVCEAIVNPNTGKIQEEFDDFVNKVDRSQLPEGIKFELK